MDAALLVVRLTCLWLRFCFDRQVKRQANGGEREFYLLIERRLCPELIRVGVNVTGYRHCGELKQFAKSYQA